MDGISPEQYDKLQLLRRRFVHRADTYGLQWYSRAQGKGGWKPAVEDVPCPQGCPRIACSHKPRRPLTDQDLYAHIIGTQTVGVYQLGAGDTVSWLCLDIDLCEGVKLTDTDARQKVHDIAAALRAYLRAERIPALLEDTTHKGMHFWVFFSNPVPALKALLVGRHIVGEQTLPEGTMIEVFPKQAGNVPYGNLVRMPLGTHLKTGQRCVFVDNSFVPLRDQWRVLRDVPTVDEAFLDAYITRHQVQRETAAPIRTGNTLVNARTPMCMTAIMENGLTQSVRDEGAFRVACYLRDRGVPDDLARVMLEEWNHKNDPPLDEGTIDRKVGSAYRAPYSCYPCANPAFDRYCSTACSYYPSKRKLRKDLQ